MGWACGMYGGQHKCVHTFDREPGRKRPLEDLGIYGWILQCILKGMRVWTGVVGLRTGTGGRDLDNELTVFFTNLMHKFFISIHLLYPSTCFEHYCAHLQEENYISTASGFVTLFR